jgi:predicted RNase H-like nuclease
MARQIAWSDGLDNDDEIVRFIATASEQHPALVAIDAPLIVPNQAGARPCDREITRVFGRFQAGAHPANRRLLERYGGLRAERLTERIVQELGFAHNPYIARCASTRQVLEVYPHPAMVALFDLHRTLKYKRGSIEQRRTELGRLRCHLLTLVSAYPALSFENDWLPDVATLKGIALKRHEDLLDSLFCAYIAAYCWCHGSTHYEIFGSVREGYILVPIPPDQRSRFGLSLT